MTSARQYIVTSSAAIVLLLSSFPAYAAYTSIGGQVGLGYAEAEDRVDGETVSTADTFSQRYSISSSTAGNIYNQRSGPYSIRLDYENLSYSTNIDDGSYSPSEQSFSYVGRFLLNLTHLNHLKLTFITYHEEYITSTFGESKKYTIDLDNVYAERTVLAASWGNNGYNKYSFLISSDGMGSGDSDDGRNKKVRFSAGKGANWFYLWGDESSSEGEATTTTYGFIVGNIESQGYSAFAKNAIGSKRVWYRLTNWLEISSDFHYTKTSVDDGDEENSHEIYFLARGSRPAWSIYLDPSYIESQDETQRSSQISLPFSLGFNLSQYASVGSSTSYQENINKNLTSQESTKSISFRQGLGANFTGQKWNIDTDYAYSRGSSEDSNSYSHGFGVRAFTGGNRRVNYSLNYNFNRSVSESDGVNGDTASNNHSFSVAANVSVSPGTHFNLVQTYDNLQTETVTDTERSENYNTRLDANHRFGPSTYLEFEAERNMDYTDGEKVSTADEMRAHLSSKINSRLESDLRISHNRTSAGDADSENSLLSGYLTYKASDSFSSTTSARYQEESREDFDGEELNFTQSLIYTHYRIDFRKRVLYNIAGSFSYQREAEAGVSESKYKEYAIVLNYYPTTAFSCGTSYTWSENETKNSARFSFHYPLLTFSGNYSLTQSESGDSESESDGYSLSLTKRF